MHRGPQTATSSGKSLKPSERGAVHARAIPSCIVEPIRDEFTDPLPEHKKSVWCTGRRGRAVGFWLAFSAAIITVRGLVVREGRIRCRRGGRPCRRPWPVGAFRRAAKHGSHADVCRPQPLPLVRPSYAMPRARPSAVPTAGISSATPKVTPEANPNAIPGPPPPRDPSLPGTPRLLSLKNPARRIFLYW